MSELYRPPAPQPLSPLRSLLRVIREGDGNLLSLVPEAAYRERITALGYSRRSIILVNDPAAIRHVMTDPVGEFPKNDLFVGALEPLVGDSVFVSHGERWKRQRAMIDPAFSQLRIGESFPAMAAAVDDFERVLQSDIAGSTTVSLDVKMSQLTADVICRTMFSTPLANERAADVFSTFSEFERSVASVNLRELILARPWSQVHQPPNVQVACQRIRSTIGEMLEPRLADPDHGPKDIVSSMLAARDPVTDKPFTHSELVDQIGVFFLAGHETTASALTWAMYILAMQPTLLARLRQEIKAVAGDGPIRFEHLKELRGIRDVFKETLRLYPPITFIPRVAAEATTIAGVRIKRGAMIMISPWATHRNQLLWNNADRFDPSRFSRATNSDQKANTFLSFGMGPRVCVGAAFATTESTLILARLLRAYQFEPLQPESVRPVARLTTRPATQIRCRVTRVSDA